MSIHVCISLYCDVQCLSNISLTVTLDTLDNIVYTLDILATNIEHKPLEVTMARALTEKTRAEQLGNHSVTSAVTTNPSVRQVRRTHGERLLHGFTCSCTGETQCCPLNAACNVARLSIRSFCAIEELRREPMASVPEMMLSLICVTEDSIRRLQPTRVVLAFPNQGGVPCGVERCFRSD